MKHPHQHWRKIDELFNINGPLLARQRLYLIEHCQTLPDNHELWGLVALLDEFADVAHDSYGHSSIIDVNTLPASAPEKDETDVEKSL